MENPQGPDSTAGKTPDAVSAAAAGSGRTTPGSWANGGAVAAAAGQQGVEDVSRLARAALFGGNGGADAAAAAAAAGLLDPLSAQQLTPEQLSAMLGTGGGYTAAALGGLGGAADTAALNALLLGGGINLNQLAAHNLQLAGLGDLSTLGALVGGDGADMDDQGGAGGAGAGGGGGKGGNNLNVTSNKQLSSRFRGVCWNKKNKRWQAAINSSGKYLYLGSFTNEDDAARQFDKAAIKLRGKKAKLNFEYADYVDENGELIDDIVLPQGATGKDEQSRGGAGGGGGGSGGVRRASKSAAACSDAANLGMAGLDADMYGMSSLASLMQQGAWQASARGGKTPVLATPLALEKEQVSVLLPAGCTLELMLPVQDPAAGGGNGSSGGNGSRTLFGVVYKDPSSGMYGAGVWTGYMFKAFGLYSSDEAALQTARCAGEMLFEDRDLRVSGGVANQQSMGLMSPTALMGGPGGPAAAAAAAAAAAGFPQDALALAGLAAAAGAPGRAGAGAGLLGLPGGPAGLVGAGMGGLANVSLAQAAQLAQQAAAEQGLPMNYPPLSVALPTGTAPLQLLPGGGAAGGGDAAAAAAAAAAGGLDIAAAAASKAIGEAEMQQLMAQLMAQQAPQQLGGLGAAAGGGVQLPALTGAPPGVGAAGVGAAGAGGQGGEGFLKLANLDMTQLRAQLMEQQQQQQQGDGEGGSAAADQDAAAAGKRRLGEGEGGDGDGDGSAAAGEAAAGEEGPVVKRIKAEGVLDGDAAAAAAAAGVAVPGAAVVGGGEMLRMDLRDALKLAQAAGAGGAAAAAAEGAAAVPGVAAAVAAAGGGGDMARMDLQDALKMLQNVGQPGAPQQD